MDDDGLVKMVQLHVENANYAEVRAVKYYGHWYLNEEQEGRRQQQKKLQKELDELKKQMQEKQDSAEASEEIKQRFTAQLNELKELLPQRVEDDKDFSEYSMQSILLRYKD